MGLFRNKKKPFFTKASRRKIRRHHGYIGGFFRRKGTMLIVTPKKYRTAQSRGRVWANRLNEIFQGRNPDREPDPRKVNPTSPK